MPEEQLQSQQAVEEMERPVANQDKLETTGSQPEDVENTTLESQKKVRRLAKKPSSPPPAASSYKSYWPFALAILLSISLMGVITYPILFFIGVVLCVVVVIAWGVERK